MKWKNVISPVTVILMVCLIASPNCVNGDQHSISAEVKSDLHTIQISLERYCEDHSDSIAGETKSDCEYPEDISMLIGDYMKEFPINPYTKKQMKNIELGSEPQTGEFTYVPLYENGKVRSYFLFAYGDEMPAYNKELEEYGFKHILMKLNGRGVNILPSDSPPFEKSDLPAIEDVFLKGADTPTLLDKWKKPGQGGPESTENGNNEGG